MSIDTPTTFDVGVTALTDVDAISRISLDIRDMADHIGRNEFIDARRIYEEGKHASQYDEFGNELDKFLSLQGMANEWRRGNFNEHPSHMFQILGLADAGQSVDEALAAHGGYADAYITEQLNDFSAGTLGAQASTILVVSMYAAHQLWSGVLDCFAVSEGYGPSGKINPKKAFDNFIALYIGAGQTLAPDWDGDMLYELAQAGGENFGTVDSEGEARVNSEIKTAYQSIQRVLSLETYCQNDASLQLLWRHTNHILAKMRVPMMQMLIHSMKQEDQQHKVRMYALAVVPQLSQCRPSVHGKLKGYLLDKEYDKRDFERILALLQESYDCLGFTCIDIGAHQVGTELEVPECLNNKFDYRMAGYKPKADVRTLSRVDLDIWAVDQLLKFPSTTKNQMAQLYYKYGREAENVEINTSRYGRSHRTPIAEMTDSSSEEVKWSPYKSAYSQYFMEMGYDDNAIMSTFLDTTGDMEQRRAFIVHLMKLNVVPQYMMGIIGLTLQLCGDADKVAGDKIESVLYWDALAALYIGSLAGAVEETTDDGIMLWNLANNRARQFNTQSTNYVAKVNDEMTTLFYAGRAQLERQDCVGFEKTASRVLHLMLVPLFQSTIWHAILLDKIEIGSNDKVLAAAEACALSILPIVQKYDPAAAAVVERNMFRSRGVKPALEGPQAVADALFKVLDDLGWGCEYIGQSEGVDACENFVRSSRSSLFGANAATILVGFASIVAGFLTMW